MRIYMYTFSGTMLTKVDWQTITAVFDLFCKFSLFDGMWTLDGNVMLKSII